MTCPQLHGYFVADENLTRSPPDARASGSSAGPPLPHDGGPSL